MKISKVKEHFYYDLSRIMKHAHELKNTQGCSMKMALLYAWEQAKRLAAKTVAIVNRIVEEKLKERNMNKHFIDISHLTGSEKQRKYACDIAESIERTVAANDTQGYFADGENKTIKRYVSSAQADAYQAAKMVICQNVNNMKTLGQFLSGYQQISKIQEIARNLEALANKKNKSACVCVKEMIEKELHDVAV